MIGAGGVATVAAFKIAQNADVFTEFMIASRRKVKCDQIVEAIKKKAAANSSLFTLHSSLFLLPLSPIRNLHKKISSNYLL